MNTLNLEVIFAVKSTARRDRNSDYVTVINTFSVEVPALKASYNLLTIHSDSRETTVTQGQAEEMNRKLPGWLLDKGCVTVNIPYDRCKGEAFFAEFNSAYRCGFGYKGHVYKTEITKAEAEAMNSCAFKDKLLKAFADQETVELAEIGKSRPEWNKENVSKWLADSNYENQVDPESLIKYFENRDKQGIGVDNAMRLISTIAQKYAYGYEAGGLIRRWAVDGEDKLKVTRPLQFGSTIPSSDYKFIRFFENCANAPVVSLEERISSGIAREDRFYSDLERFNKEGSFDDAYLQFADDQEEYKTNQSGRLETEIKTAIGQTDLAGKTPEEIFALAYQLGIKNGLDRISR